MKTMLLSNINMQPLVTFLAPWDVTVGEFNSLILDLANPSSLAYSPEFTHILCLFDTDSLLGDTFYGEGAPEQCEFLLQALDSFCQRDPGKIVVSTTFCISTGRWLSFADLTHASSLRSLEIRLNDRLIELARIRSNLLLIDMELLFRRNGEQASLSNAFWYIGRIRYSNQMLRALATHIHQAVSAYANRSRKVLVLDLDKTLWGGIVGEEGALGIELSEEGKGRCHRDFQRALKALSKTGVLLAIASKNNPGDLDEVFEKNPMMVLRREDFSCIRANWKPKPQNIVEIAESLNLGTDSFVFIDDNPVEREMVAASLPEVAVPAFPARVEDLSTWLLHEIVPAHFGRVHVSAEDANKTEQYRAREDRRQLAVTLNFEEFLADLKVECQIHVDPIDQVARIAQMTQKTNQFNLTTRRYQIPEIESFVKDPDYAVALIDYRDRFGTEGAVGLAILDYRRFCIDTLLISCRVIGRRVEDRLLEKACELFSARNCSSIIGEFIPTSKNQQTRHFYDSHGFVLLSEDSEGRRTYEKELNDR